MNLFMWFKLEDGWETTYEYGRNAPYKLFKPDEGTKREGIERSLMLLVYVVVPTDFLVRMRSRAFTRPSVT